VLDLSTEIAGPYATKLLADAGADVVKVEHPDGGDPLRRWTASGAPIPAGDDGALFRFLHTSKRSLALDLGSATGRSELLRLVAGADLVVESFAPGRIEAMGLGPEALWRTNPAVSLVSISPFGRGGPWSNRPATEFTLQALCGSIASRGTPDRPPLHAGGRLGEWLTAGFTALGALTAWWRTRRSGRGEHVDVSMLEAMTIGIVHAHTLHKSFGTASYMIGRQVEIPSIEPAADGWVGFCTITNQQWRDFLVLVERPELVDDADLATFEGRWAQAAAVNAFVHTWTRAHTVGEIVDRASALRIPVAPVGTGATIPGFDHFRTRGAFVPHPGASWVQPRPPYRLERATLRPMTPSPRLGAHTGAVLAERPSPRSLAMGTAPTPLPFADLRVVDFTAFWAGPFVTHWLATLGADVVKVESIQRPDGMRFASSRPPGEGAWWEWSPMVHAVNIGKRGITLDLGRPAGIALVKRLVADADVVVENFSPRVMDNLGLGWETLRALNSRLVMVRMPAFGLDGPWRDRVGFAQTMEQTAGMAWITGHPDAAPVIPRGPCDPLAGMHATVALLVALEHRRQTGEGQLVEATMVEAALNAAAEQVLEHGAYGRLLERAGNRGPTAAPQNLYACRGTEQWLALAVATDAQWAALVDALGRPAWACDPELGTATGRRAAHDRIDDEVARWCAARDLDTVVEALVGHGIPAAPVASARDVDLNPQLRARHFFESLSHPVVGTHEYAGLPMRFSAGAPRWYRRAAPTLGQHTVEVLRERLGLDDDEIAALRRDKIIGEWPTGA
jgi:crotonobetainyl-CoA:carnitine CoA-transferase CaiB-like acyl-CoA transferase